MDNLIKILLAILFGGVLGAERGHAGKAAGMRTYMLVTLAATTFTLIAQDASILKSVTYDPARIISQVILGIGFIGGGLIFAKKDHIQGITTAAGLWISTAIGIAIGVNLYTLATLVTLLSFIILAILPHLEEKINPRQDKNQ